MDAHEKIAVVTGAGSGIGKAAAVALFADGWHVVFAGRRLERLELAIAEGTVARESLALRSGHTPRAIAVQTEVTQPQSVQNQKARTQATFGRLDLLFNNAGIAPRPLPVEEVPFEMWTNVIDTNLTGMFLCIQEAVRLMKSQTPRGGRIINNGSISAQKPRANSIAYTAAKHAVTGLTKSLSLDVRDFDIACGKNNVNSTENELGSANRAGVRTTSSFSKLDARLVGDTVLQMANRPRGAGGLGAAGGPAGGPGAGRG